MKILLIIPTQKEHDYFLESCIEQGFSAEKSRIGRISVVRFPDLDVTLSLGGLGKVMFAVHTQHLLDSEAAWELVVCAGAAGGLGNHLSVGDIVVGIETIEHDVKNKFGEPRMPSFKGDEATINGLRQLVSNNGSFQFQVHFASIASGDEDVVDVERKEEIKSRTGAIAVAWEGAGGARACQFSVIPFVEIRAISDGANNEAPSDFRKNLPRVMTNMAVLISAMAKGFNI